MIFDGPPVSLSPRRRVRRLISTKVEKECLGLDLLKKVGLHISNYYIKVTRAFLGAILQILPLTVSLTMREICATYFRNLRHSPLRLFLGTGIIIFSSE